MGKKRKSSQPTTVIDGTIWKRWRVTLKSGRVVPVWAIDKQGAKARARMLYDTTVSGGVVADTGGTTSVPKPSASNDAASPAKKSRKICPRLTDAELSALKDNAANAGLNLRDYIVLRCCSS